MSIIWTIVGYLVALIYLGALTYITIFCLLQFHLLVLYRRSQNKTRSIDRQMPASGEWPHVTIQLPIFNERFVVERLIDNICRIEYPKDKLQIQILDDSTDTTVELAREKVHYYQQQGIDIVHIRRKDRKGYKAGALQYGLKRAKGPFIAIFDADFLPDCDFLYQTIPYFDQPEVAVVQTRWDHINESYSILTRLQAFQLNVHFSVEQSGREAADLLLQFNGTGGVIRRTAIEDAGGWEADTLTEDLDLSYRMQLKGWRIQYLENTGSPAELPVEMNGLKSQQFRWMKGGAETAKKHLPKIWQSDLSYIQKLHASVHLLSGAVFLVIFTAGIISVPALFFFPLIEVKIWWLHFFLIALFSVSMVYFTGNFLSRFSEGRISWKSIGTFLFMFPIFLALSMGLSLHNSIATIQGFVGKKSHFIRTPKFNIQGLQDSFKGKEYLSQSLPWTTIAEGFLTLYFLLAMVYALNSGTLFLLIYHLLLTIGFGVICYYSVRHFAYR